jgi:hypothetical protein
MWLFLNRDIFDVLNIPIRDKNSNSNIPIRDDVLADIGLNMLYYVRKDLKGASYGCYI